MTPREERLKTRMTDYLFSTNQSIREICEQLGLTPTAAQFWLFHGYSLNEQQEQYINRFLEAVGY